MFKLDLDKLTYTSSSTNSGIVGDGEFLHQPDQIVQNRGSGGNSLLLGCTLRKMGAEQLECIPSIPKQGRSTPSLRPTERSTMGMKLPDWPLAPMGVKCMLAFKIAAVTKPVILIVVVCSSLRGMMGCPLMVKRWLSSFIS